MRSIFSSARRPTGDRNLSASDGHEHSVQVRSLIDGLRIEHDLRADGGAFESQNEPTRSDGVARRVIYEESIVERVGPIEDVYVPTARLIRRQWHLIVEDQRAARAIGRAAQKIVVILDASDRPRGRARGPIAKRRCFVIPALCGRRRADSRRASSASVIR